ncbi:hypothetical protein IFR04_002768 [Cadophora malorum]|uniref:Uncharacterized protein n=1 Tax=Cadophora malorum TaxID=108018 RepID=A0A8H8BU69_9HELO|nr:hypothetical protein IFR04_002768 [Cadophora malorum]
MPQDSNEGGSKSHSDWAQKVDEKTSESDKKLTQPWKELLEKSQPASTDEDFVRVHDAGQNPPTPSLAA